ncbi:MAG: hypothetical protein KME20_22130 [Kaiparowitsia implicata GSE-PSE-MK54-09C]|nr:hypothetical protein [Kaiparowitsia implicata GSE-PSE-MK54-09C]
MFSTVLTHRPDDTSHSISMRDRVQIALAIAEEDILKTLLTQCTPPLVQPHLVGAVTAKVGVPVEAHRTVDSVIAFEAVNCALARSPEDIEQQIAAQADSRMLNRQYLAQTRCESDTQVLGQHISLAQAIALLAQSGFSPDQVDAIINVPQEAWHRSWWYALDSDGNLSEPFLRLMRTIRFPDGTFTLQYKDFYAQNKPSCFTSQEERVLIEIRTEHRSFRKTLERINLFRQQLGIAKAILICETMSELEAQGFISQGISIYATSQPLELHTRAHCAHCTNEGCQLHGQGDTGVMMCDRFRVE